MFIFNPVRVRIFDFYTAEPIRMRRFILNGGLEGARPSRRLYLQDSLGQAGLVCEAGPVFTVGVVFLGKVRLQRSELLAAEARPDSLGPPGDPPTCRPVVRSWLWTADRLLPLT